MKNEYIDKAWLSKLLEFYSKSLSKRNENIIQENKMDDRYFRNIQWTSSENFKVGTLCYLLGDFHNARYHFSEVCKYSLKYWEYDPWEYNISGHIPNAGRMIACAIFSKIPELRKQCANKILENEKMLERYIPGYIYAGTFESIALSNFIIHQNDQVINNILRIEDQEIKDMEKRDYSGDGKFIGRGMMLKGLIMNDKYLIIKGIQSALEKYTRVHKKEPIPFCLDAIKYLILTKEQGIIFELCDIPKKIHRPIFRFFEDQ